MLKKFIALASISLVMATNVQIVSADIFINKTLETPIQNPQEYDSLVRQSIYNKTFFTEVSREKGSSVETKFNGDNISIFYRDKDTTNYYKGTFSIISSKLKINLTDVYKSEKYGFYTHTDYSENPVSVDNQLSINNDNVTLRYVSNEFPELNTTLTFEENDVELKEDDKIELRSLDSVQKEIFQTKNIWKIQKQNDNFVFTSLYFLNKDKIYLIDEKNYDKIVVIEGSYLIENNKLKIEPLKYYKINKMTNNLKIVDLKNSENISDNEVLKYKEAGKLTYTLDYLDSTNSYFISDGTGEDIVKIIPYTIAEFKVNMNLATKNEIDSLIEGKTIKLSEDNNTAYITFLNGRLEARFISDDEEQIVTGTYKVKDGIIETAFRKQGYFLDSAYFDSISSDGFSATMYVNSINDKLYTSFITTNFKNFGTVKEEAVYMLMEEDAEYKERTAPITISNESIGLIINNKTYTVTKNDTIYKFKFFGNKEAEIYINRKDKIEEAIKGHYSIKDGEIRISVNNQYYNYGFYNNYSIGQIEKENNNNFMTFYLTPKYDSKDIYFSIYDGNQNNLQRVDDYSYRNNVSKKEGYYKAIQIKDEKIIPEFKKVSKDSLDKKIAGNTFKVDYITNNYQYNENYYFDKNGNVKIVILDGRNSTNSNTSYTINARYTTENNKITIKYNDKFMVDRGYLVKETVGIKSSVLEIVENQSDYYIKLQDGVYLKFNTSANNNIKDIPVTLTSVEINSKLAGKTVNIEGTDITFNRDNTIKKVIKGETYTGNYSVSDGKITADYKSFKDTYYIMGDKNNLYFAINEMGLYSTINNSNLK